MFIIQFRGESVTMRKTYSKPSIHRVELNLSESLAEGTGIIVIPGENWFSVTVHTVQMIQGCTDVINRQMDKDTYDKLSDEEKNQEPWKSMLASCITWGGAAEDNNSNGAKGLMSFSASSLEFEGTTTVQIPESLANELGLF